MPVTVKKREQPSLHRVMTLSDHMMCGKYKVHLEATLLHALYNVW